MKIHNIAIIGCGYWGQKIIATFQYLKPAISIKIFDVDITKTAPFQNQCTVYPDFTTLLNDKSISAVIVATPLSTHYTLCQQLLLASKHVLCEKPLAPTTQQCQTLHLLSKKMQVHLATGFTYLFHPFVTHLKTIIDTTVIGTLHYIHFERYNYGPIRNDTHVIFDLASHDIAIAYYLLGKPTSVSCTAQKILNTHTYDSAHIHLKFQFNIQVHISVSWLESIKTRKCKVVGTQGTIYYDEIQNPYLLSLHSFSTLPCTDTEVHLKNTAIQIKNFVLDPSPPLQVEIQSFLEHIENDVPTLNNALFAQHITHIIACATESHLQNGKSVNL